MDGVVMTADVNFIDALAKQFNNALVMAPMFAMSAVAFVLCSALFYIFYERGSNRATFRSVMSYVFPRKLYRHSTTRVDIVHFFLNIGLWAPLLGLIMLFLIGINVQALLVMQFGARSAISNAGWIVVPMQFMIIYLSREFGGYFGHYLMHKVPFLWGLHRSHHSAEAMTLFASARAHPFESLFGGITHAAFGGLGTGLGLYFMGTDLEPATTAALSVLYASFVFLNYMQHTHMWISFGKLNYILNAPVMHYIHHSAEERHRDTNLGTTLMIFDWLFGTLYVPKEREDFRVGLNDKELGENNPHITVRGFYLEPIKYAWGTLRKKSSPGEKLAVPS